ncbi:uncharacterized protein BDV14DRAFT_201315 [Aspergillus stella-maris]|uniref:uncharacterized protein n=1 Tax=Aspergillus stella-maris TaxID=1810926 RepID=UPI003CCC9922
MDLTTPVNTITNPKDEINHEDLENITITLPPPKPHRLRLRLPRNPEIMAKKLSRRYLRKYNKYHPNAPNVHSRPITFTHAQAKANWRDSIPDAKHRETFAMWWHAPKHNKSTWLGCFSTWTRSWVGDSAWDKQPWHVWGVAAIKVADGKGKAVIIYDCDPLFPKDCDDEEDKEVKPTTRIHARPGTFMLGMQANLLYHIRRVEKANIKYVFYNTDTRRAGRNRCLRNTLRWMRKLVEYGDEPFVEGFDKRGVSLDPRANGCALVTRR